MSRRIKLCFNARKYELTETSTKLTAADKPGIVHIPVVTLEDIGSLIDSSELDPIIQIRRENGYRHTLQASLYELVTRATLDYGQLQSFNAALKFPVHCTQGPPGTGKSYLGVVITQALLIIRKLWIQISPSIGKPPILVLSYKNHAIDEFLLDLINQKNMNIKYNLIRIGGGSLDPNLTPYSEKNNVRNNQLVVKSRQKIEQICHATQLQSKLLELHSKIHLSNLPNSEGSESNEEKSYKRKLQYVAAENLQHVVARILKGLKLNQDADLIQSFSMDESFFEQTGVETDALIDFFNEAEAQTIAANTFSLLKDGVKHIKSKMQNSELLWMWMRGFIPPPQCTYLIDKTQCTESCEKDMKYCYSHLCQALECKNSKHSSSELYCETHRCFVVSCLSTNLGNGQKYCFPHACTICLEEGKIADIALDEPPRNTCEKHPLCCSMISGEQCYNVLKVEKSSLYCELHLEAKCKGLTAKGKPCLSRSIISLEACYCLAHKNQIPRKMATSEQSSKCLGKNKKKRPCNAQPLSGYLYCANHIHLNEPEFKQHYKQEIVKKPQESKREDIASAASAEGKYHLTF